MAIHKADFEAGTNAATIATTDTGSTDAWTTVAIASGGTVTYDNVHPAHGTLAAKLVTTTSGDDNLQWSTSVPTDHYGRAYYYFPANPGSAGMGIAFVNAGGRLCLTTAGKPEARDSGGSIIGTMTNSISLNQWIRLEWHMVHNASTGSFEIKLFNSPDSSTVTETLTLTSVNMGSAPTFTAFGMTNTALANFTMYLDNIVEYAAGYPGPFPVNSVAPAITGSAPVGSTLACDGGTWNGTFTLGYQWTRDGANIAAATSSTYLTQAGDATHAIGCTVTATGQVATNESASTASSNTVTVTAAASDTAQPTGLSGQYVLLISGSN